MALTCTRCGQWMTLGAHVCARPEAPAPVVCGLCKQFTPPGDKTLETIAADVTAAYQKGVADASADKARLVEESYQRGRREALAEALSRLVERADVLGDQEAEAISRAAKLGEARRELHAAAARLDALTKGGV